jgi:hypothetical protein
VVVVGCVSAGLSELVSHRNGRGQDTESGHGGCVEFAKRYSIKLELELIQTHMTQKPMLRVEAGARALRILIKKCASSDQAGRELVA